MSTAYRLSNRESALPRVVLLAKLEEHGILVAETKGDKVCVSNGTSFLWCYLSEDGTVADFEVFAQTNNDARPILDAIEEICQESVLSEHDDGFFEGDDEDEEVLH